MTGAAFLPERDLHACSVGVAEMDARHREFAKLLSRLDAAGDTDFIGLFDRLIEHTLQHFGEEEARMRHCDFPAIAEHSSEHRRVLGELAQVCRLVSRGRVSPGRAYVREGLLQWFRLHLATMDSALAAHWKRHAAGN